MSAKIVQELEIRVKLPLALVSELRLSE